MEKWKNGKGHEALYLVNETYKYKSARIPSSPNLLDPPPLDPLLLDPPPFPSKLPDPTTPSRPPLYISVSALWRSASPLPPPALCLFQCIKFLSVFISISNST